MRGCGRRAGARAACALAAAVVALGACGGSGGGGGFFVATTPFSAQLLPLQIDGDPTGVETFSGAGDVAFASGGDALVVGGGTDEVLRVSRTSGAVTTFAADVTGDGAVLHAIAVDPGDGTVYVGADDGEIHAIDDEGVVTLLVDTGDGPVNGMAFAPSGFGDVGGQLLVASEDGGILAVDPEEATFATLASPEMDGVYADLAFLDGVLYAVDRENAKVDAIEEDDAGALQTVTFVETADADFVAPDGLAADAVNRQLLVADPATGDGDGTLFAVTVPEPPEGGEDPDEPVVSEIARYAFDPDAPNGLAFDGVRNLLFVTDDLPETQAGMTLRGVVLPAFDASFPVPIFDTDEGFGDLTFDLDGSLVGTGNAVGESEVDDGENRVFRVRRDGTTAVVRRDVGDALTGERLLAIELDPATGTLYVGTSRGNVFALNDGGTSLFSSLPSPDPEKGEFITGLALAPANAGELAGQLVAVTSVVVGQGQAEVGGSLYAIDFAAPDTAVLLGPAPTVPTGEDDEEDGDLTGALFDSDGNLYVLGQDAGVVYRVTVASGTADFGDGFAGGIDRPVGIAIDEGGQRLFVAQTGSTSIDDALLEIALDDRTGPMEPPPEELTGEFLFLGGVLPSGLAFDGLGDVFLVTDDIPLAVAVDRFTAFPTDEE